MYKLYCDRCNKEIEKGGSQRVKCEEGRFGIEVMASVDGVMNGGHLCQNCVRDIVSLSALERPAPEQKREWQTFDGNKNVWWWNPNDRTVSYVPYGLLSFGDLWQPYDPERPEKPKPPTSEVK